MKVCEIDKEIVIGPTVFLGVFHENSIFHHSSYVGAQASWSGLPTKWPSAWDLSNLFCVLNVLWCFISMASEISEHGFDSKINGQRMPERGAQEKTGQILD